MEKRNYWKIARVVLFFVIIATFILFLWPGCATPTTPTGSPPTSIGALEVRLAALEAWKPTVDGSIAAKALTTDLTALTTKVNALVAGTGLSAAQVDAAIDAKLAAYVAKVTALENRILVLEGSSSGTGLVDGEYGEILDEDGDLVLWLERVSGCASDELLTKQGLNEGRFDLVVVNLDQDSSHDFKISFRFDPEKAVTLMNTEGSGDCTTLPLTFDDTKTKMSGTGGLTFVTSRAGSNTASLSPVVVYQSNTGRILKGDAEDHTVWLYVDQCTNDYVEWEWDITIDDKD